MREASHVRLHPQAFPEDYMKKFREYRKRRIEILSETRTRKAVTGSNGFSENCRQAIYLTNEVFCCVLKKPINSAACKGCPCFEREPLQYSLFRRE
jgi:hypothetical protein